LVIEMLSGEEYDFMVDWWSMGVIAFELVGGVPPFFGDSPAEVFENIMNYEEVLKDAYETLAEDPDWAIPPDCWSLITRQLTSLDTFHSSYYPPVY
jgi:serine/threonine protein kinase